MKPLSGDRKEENMEVDLAEKAGSAESGRRHRNLWDSPWPSLAGRLTFGKGKEDGSLGWRSQLGEGRP